MTKQFFKTVLAGILAGVVVFMMPFLILKVFILFFLIRSIFRLMGGKRRHRHMRYAYAHNYRNMSEDDRKAFMQKYGNRCGWNSKPEDHFGEGAKDKTTGV